MNAGTPAGAIPANVSNNERAIVTAGFVSVAPRSASASIPSHTPAIVANGGSGHADTINSSPERSASPGDLRDYAARLVNRHNCHCLC
jgi:hypothetical protein